MGRSIDIRSDLTAASKTAWAAPVDRVHRRRLTLNHQLDLSQLELSQLDKVPLGCGVISWQPFFSRKTV